MSRLQISTANQTIGRIEYKLPALSSIQPHISPSCSDPIISRVKSMKSWMILEHHFSLCQIMITGTSMSLRSQGSRVRFPAAIMGATAFFGQMVMPIPFAREACRLRILENLMILGSICRLSSDRSMIRV